MNCPRCGSQNIFIQRELTANVGASTNRVAIKAPKKSKGCIYWMFIGFWYKPLYWMCIGW